MDDEDGSLEDLEESRPWTPVGKVVAAVAIFAVAAGVTAFLVRREPAGQGTPTAATSPPATGTACTALAAAEAALAAGDDAAFRAAVDEAAEKALRALDRSGEMFGRPEEAALKLQAEVEGDGPVSRAARRWLRAGLEACSDAGSSG